MTEKKPMTYAGAGVDIAAGNALVNQIKSVVASTTRPGADTSLGGFGGLFDLKATGLKDPVLVSGTDGVGTKLMLAFETCQHSTIGVDLVAMCANDILAQGALPLFFLDYFATGKLDQSIAADVVSGIADGCRQAGCALIGGETAEMPDMYSPGHYDLAGFCVGAAERDQLLPRKEEMVPGDPLIALPSSGPHSNGYSLIRKIVERSGVALSERAPFDAETSLGEALLTPTRIYVDNISRILGNGTVKGLAHITGGGLTENAPRMCPDHLVPEIDRATLISPPVFDWLQREGNVSDQEMDRTFNMGVGMVLCVSAEHMPEVLEHLIEHGEQAYVCGELRARS